jgi:hypothetical protein
MSLITSKHLNNLREILKLKQENSLFVCINDLVVNGLSLSRFADGRRKPSRQDITQFILAWLKYSGISAAECQDWLIEYCLDVLSAISSSSKSQIRHSTKSNIKYIYKSNVTLDCGCENNVFKALCNRHCPVYDEMNKKYQERIASEANRSYEIITRPAKPEVMLPPPSVKEQYKDQFGQALEVASSGRKQGYKIKKIVQILNEQDLKTRTGKKWTYPLLQIELKKLQVEKEPGFLEKPGS